MLNYFVTGLLKICAEYMLPRPSLGYVIRVGKRSGDTSVRFVRNLSCSLFDNNSHIDASPATRGVYLATLKYEVRTSCVNLEKTWLSISLCWSKLACLIIFKGTTSSDEFMQGHEFYILYAAGCTGLARTDCMLWLHAMMIWIIM